MSLIKFNQPVNLNLQLEGREEDKFVRAFLKDADGVDLATIDLTHTSNGLYQNDSFLMPDTNEVTAQFLVYDDASYLIESCEYYISFDKFILYDPSLDIPIVEKEEILSGLIHDSGLLEGRLLDDNQIVFGFLEEKNAILQGLLFDQDMIIGHLESDHRMLEGTIIEEKQNLLGEIYC